MKQPYINVIEIGNDYYCPSIDVCETPSVCKTCIHKHRKHPTCEQFKEEYGREYPDDGAVYSLQQNMHFEKEEPSPKWRAMSYAQHKNNLQGYENRILGIFVMAVVCACTPFSKPDDNWRPE